MALIKSVGATNRQSRAIPQKFVALYHRNTKIRVCSDERDDIQLFRERLSEKVHATIPKGIVGGFKFTVL